MIDLCTLGTGGAIPLPDRALSSLDLRINGRCLLIDCGEGTQTQLRRLGWGFRCIDAVFITHYHADHCGGLPGFLLSMAKTGRTEPLHIYGPVGLERLLTAVRFFCPQLPYPIEPHVLELREQTFDLLGLGITVFPLNHGIPCLGLHIGLEHPGAFLPEKAKALGIPVRLWKQLQKGQSVILEDGRLITPEMVMGPARQGISLLYATDTRPVDAIVHYGRGTQLMILQGMYGEDDKSAQAHKNRHMLFSEAARLAAQAGTERLLLTHFSNCVQDPSLYLEDTRRIFEQTEAAADLMVLSLDYAREV